MSASGRSAPPLGTRQGVGSQPEDFLEHLLNNILGLDFYIEVF